MGTAVLTSSRNGLGLRSDERIGLIVAGVAHVAIIAALAIAALRAPSVVPPPQRVTVNLSEDVGLEATAPQVAPEAKASVADRIGEEVVPPKTKPEPPKPVPPKPAPPKPTPPKPVATKAPNKPVVSPKTSSVVPKPAPKPTTAPPPKKPGGGRIGENFLDGKGSKVDSNAPIPASQIGAEAKASLVQALSREIKPQWQGRSPQGLDADQLVTVLSFSLNPDGSLAGVPKVVSQSGINDSNRAQAGRHAEIAISAVQRAAPFNLPKEYYEAWKKVSKFTFDRNLSQ